MHAPKPSELRDPQDALRAYLDEMLHLATTLHAADAATAPALVRESTVELVSAPEPAPLLEAEATPVVTGPQSAPAVPAATESAADRFVFPLQCLMFRVADHLLALPLIELAGIIPAATRLTRLPRSPAELLGLLQHRERTLRVVDSGALLSIGGAFDAQCGHLLVLAAGDWALSCDAPEQVAYLERADVQWRTVDTGQLRYGTIRESLATLLDPGAICRRLERRLGA